MGKPVITKDWKMRQLVERNALASAVGITAPECTRNSAAVDKTAHQPSADVRET